MVAVRICRLHASSSALRPKSKPEPATVRAFCCLSAANVDKTALHIGAVAFTHRFGSSLNGYVHFHVCVVDGVFEEVPGDVDTEDEATPARVNTQTYRHDLMISLVSNRPRRALAC